MADPVVSAVMRQMREAMADMDLAVVTAVNRRIELASRLAAYRASHGLGDDADGRDWIRQYVASANAGPLRDEDLARLLAVIDEICGPAERRDQT